MKKTFGYVRVSTIGQARHGHSLEVQEEMIRKYFDWRYAPEGYTFADIYKDPPDTASKALVQRAGGQALAQAIDNGDVVIFAKLDRGFRDTIDLLTTVKAWEKRGVGVQMLDIGLDVSTDIGKVVLTVMGAVAEWERKRIIQRTLEGKARKRAKGKTEQEQYLGGPHVKWGYKIIGKRNCRIVEDTELRETARLFIRLWQQGWTYRRIWLFCLKEKVLRTVHGQTREWTLNAIRNAILKESALQREEGKKVASNITTLPRPVQITGG